MRDSYFDLPSRIEDAFAEIDSDIVMDLLNTDEDYAGLSDRMDKLKTQYPAARFQLLGPPEQGLGSVDLAQVRRWQDEGSIEYLGETRDVRPYVAACHALVLPSWREGTPTSIMEGMSMGRAAVVTDVPGCREVMEDGVNGFLCAAHDPRSLAAAMRRFLDDPGLLASMGAAGRELACREFDAEVVAEKILVDMRVPRAAG